MITISLSVQQCYAIFILMIYTWFNYWLSQVVCFTIYEPISDCVYKLQTSPITCIIQSNRNHYRNRGLATWVAKLILTTLSTIDNIPQPMPSTQLSPFRCIDGAYSGNRAWLFRGIVLWYMECRLLNTSCKLWLYKLI